MGGPSGVVSIVSPVNVAPTRGDSQFDGREFQAQLEEQGFSREFAQRVAVMRETRLENLRRPGPFESAIDMMHAGERIGGLRRNQSGVLRTRSIVNAISGVERGQRFFMDAHMAMALLYEFVTADPAQRVNQLDSRDWVRIGAMILEDAEKTAEQDTDPERRETLKKDCGRAFDDIAKIHAHDTVTTSYS